MTKEQQDIAWQCLPKEAREEMRRTYKYQCRNNEYNRGFNEALEEIFGHNLTSDTEPNELLVIERQDIINRYKAILVQQDPKNFGFSDYLQGQKELLESMFAAKCIPDKEPSVQCEPKYKVGDMIRIRDSYYAETLWGKTGKIYSHHQDDVWYIEIDNTIYAARESELEPYTEPEQLSVQDEPRFKVGDKVRKTRWDKDTTISKVEWHGTWETFVYQFKEQEYGFNCHKENDLTLVSKRSKDPNFSIGDKVQLKFDWRRLLKGTMLTIEDIPTIDRDNTFMYSFEETDEYIRETMLEPCTETEAKRKETQNLSHLDELSIETKDAHGQYQEAMAKESRKCDESEDDILYEKDGISLENESKIDEMMEEKELNLLELLKGCEGETFYSPALGTVWIHSINDEEIEIIATSDDYAITVDGTGRWNLFFKTHVCILFPSKELYEKYPLNPYAAWMEWQSERTPKRWRAECYDRYWMLNSMGMPKEHQDVYCHDGVDQLRYNFGNYFKDEQTAKQAAEAVRKCLEEFHAKNMEK